VCVKAYAASCIMNIRHLTVLACVGEEYCGMCRVYSYMSGRRYVWRWIVLDDDE
jgi:hypothetical protein